ncbi:MAG: hypothetical protein R2831_11695 [Chitinophagaceae bacterium]
MKNIILSAIAMLCITSVYSQTIWDSGSLTFVRTSASQQDCIVPSTCLARQNTGVIYNAVDQTGGGGQGCNFTPSNTEWAYGEISDWNTLMYAPLYQTISCAPPSMVNNPMVLHLINEDIYLQVTFTYWAMMAGGGGDFTYTRTTGPSITNSTLTVNTFLQGYYLSANTMKSVLSNQSASSNPSITDSIVISLRQSTPPYAIIESHTAALNTNGTSSADFSSPSANYYITINHRNSIETWSANPVLLSTSTSYDFTSAVGQAYGNNLIAVETNVFGIFTGDINQDASIDIFDFLEWDVDNQNFNTGYYATDLDGDGSIDIFDFLIWDPNNQNFIGAILP